MPRLKILITMPSYEPALSDLRGDRQLDLSLQSELSSELDWPVEWLTGTQILFSPGAAPKNLDAMESLRFIQIASAGYEPFIARGLPERGVRMSNARGVFDVPIGEWCIAMMINLLRDVRGMIRNQEQGTWDRDKRFQQELRGRTVGFWGYGGLARESARLLKAMGLGLHVLTRSTLRRRVNDFVVPGTGDSDGKLPDRIFTADAKAEFLRTLDFLVLAMPLTPATEGIVGEDDLRRLPRHAYLLNPARGALIREESLLRALREGWIAGAALDTHHHYPMPPDHPLWTMPNVIMTPHISGSSESTQYLPRAWDIFQQNLHRFQTGQPLLNELTPAALRGE